MERNGCIIQHLQLRGFMPKRFDDNENFDEKPEFNDDGDNDENTDFEIDDQAVIEAINIDLMQDAQRYRLLEQAAKVASQDYRWWFIDHNEKVKRIHKIYLKFLKITEKE